MFLLTVLNYPFLPVDVHGTVRDETHSVDVTDLSTSSVFNNKRT